MTKKKELKKATLVDAIKDAMESIDPRVNTIIVKDVEIDKLGDAPEANIDAIVGQEYGNIIFKNVTFSVDDTIRISDRHYISFLNCTLDKYVTLYCHDCNFNSCKVNYTLDIDSCRGIVSLTDCTFDTFSLNISGSSIINLTRCKNVCDLNIVRCINEIIINNCTGRFWSIVDSSINTVRFYCCKFTAGDVKSSRLSCLCISGECDKKVKLDALTLTQSIITTRLYLPRVTINNFNAYQTALFAGFEYDKNSIKKWDLHCTTGITPPQNTIILYKKAVAVEGKLLRNIIVKLEVPEKAQRVYCNKLKIRVSKAKVIGFYNLDGSVLPDDTEVISSYDPKFKYKIGDTVKPTKEFDTTSGLCGSGIHGYIDFVDAVKY
jgi:hypothetical protein